jgi:hypothetical protein
MSSDEDDLATRVSALEYEVLKRHARIQEALSRPEIDAEEFREIVDAHRDALFRLKELRDEQNSG